MGYSLLAYATLLDKEFGKRGPKSVFTHNLTVRRTRNHAECENMMREDPKNLFRWSEHILTNWGFEVYKVTGITVAAKDGVVYLLTRDDCARIVGIV
eukprot:1298629-Pyramimonas_sp.AAC.1